MTTWWQRFRQSDFYPALLITLGWQFVLTFIGAFIYYVLAPEFHHPLFDNYSQSWTDLFTHTLAWDGGWFRDIITHFYAEGSQPASAAFHPLFPLLVRFVQLISFGTFSVGLAGFIVTSLSMWLAITALLKMGRLFFPEAGYTWLIISLLLCAPAGFFLHQLYSEAVFLALSCWAYYFALKRHWWMACLCLGFLSATRLTFVLVTALIVLEFWRSHGWKLAKVVRDRQLLWFFLAPVGFLLYGLYLWLVRGDFLGMFSAYQHEWEYQVFNPNFIHTFLAASKASVLCLAGSEGCDFGAQFVNTMLPVAALCSLAATAYLGFWLRGRYIPLALMHCLAFVMFTLNSNVVSVHRYVLPLIGVPLIILAVFKKQQWPLWLLLLYIVPSVIVQLWLFFLFVNGYFAG